MSMFTKPWGAIPEANANWLGGIGCGFPKDGYLVIRGQTIPWPKNNTATFAVIDYTQEDFLRLKSTARYRCMTEWKLRKKADIIKALQEWDIIMQNQTPLQE